MKKFVALGDPSPLLKQSLINRGYSVIDLPRFSLLSGPVSSHCDMLFTTLRGKLFTSETYYETARNQMDFIANANGFDIVLDPHSELSHYPDEARFLRLLRINSAIAVKRYSTSIKAILLAQLQFVVTV